MYVRVVVADILRLTFAESLKCFEPHLKFWSAKILLTLGFMCRGSNSTATDIRQEALSWLSHAANATCLHSFYHFPAAAEREAITTTGDSSAVLPVHHGEGSCPTVFRKMFQKVRGYGERTP